MARRQTDGQPGHVARVGFTLIELLVVMGIISTLMAMLLPALTAARNQANAIRCESNVRQLVQALTTYAMSNRGQYPPNQASVAPGRFWYDAERIGEILHPSARQAVVGDIAVCPLDEMAARSYGMNVWASGAVDPTVTRGVGTQGSRWSFCVPQSSSLILVSEKWTNSGSAGAYVASGLFGYVPPTPPIPPGQRFGGGTGISSLTMLYGRVNCELAYMRHRAWNGAGAGTAPRGRISIGYADGHVELKSDTDLVDSTGKSTLDSLWSPLDPTINQ